MSISQNIINTINSLKQNTPPALKFNDILQSLENQSVKVERAQNLLNLMLNRIDVRLSQIDDFIKKDEYLYRDKVPLQAFIKKLQDFKREYLFSYSQIEKRRVALKSFLIFARDYEIEWEAIQALVLEVEALKIELNNLLALIDTYTQELGALEAECLEIDNQHAQILENIQTKEAQKIEIETLSGEYRSLIKAHNECYYYMYAFAYSFVDNIAQSVEECLTFGTGAFNNFTPTNPYISENGNPNAFFLDTYIIDETQPPALEADARRLLNLKIQERDKNNEQAILEQIRAKEAELAQVTPVEFLKNERVRIQQELPNKRQELKTLETILQPMYQQFFNSTDATERANLESRISPIALRVSELKAEIRQMQDALNAGLNNQMVDSRLQTEQLNNEIADLRLQFNNLSANQQQLNNEIADLEAYLSCFPQLYKDFEVYKEFEADPQKKQDEYIKSQNAINAMNLRAQEIGAEYYDDTHLEPHDPEAFGFRVGAGLLAEIAQLEADAQTNRECRSQNRQLANEKAGQIAETSQQMQEKDLIIKNKEALITQKRQDLISDFKARLQEFYTLQMPLVAEIKLNFDLETYAPPHIETIANIPTSPQRNRLVVAMPLQVTINRLETYDLAQNVDSNLLNSVKISINKNNKVVSVI